MFSQKKIIGLVGTSGAGKNEVEKILKANGACCIDADLISNEIFMQNETNIIKTFKQYNNNIETSEGKLNKALFAELVFSNSKLLQQHERFMFPLIEDKIFSLIETSTSNLIVLNAPTLHKSKLIDCVNFFLYVTCPLFLRAIRVKKRDNISLRQVLLRFKNQKNFLSFYKATEKKVYIISNFFSKTALEKKVKKTLSKIQGDIL